MREPISEVDTEQPEDALLISSGTSQSSKRPWLRWVGLVLLGVLTFACAAYWSTSSPRETAEFHGDDSVELVESKVFCHSVDCGQFAKAKARGTCEGPDSSSDDCLENCCEAIHCEDIEGWSCSADVGGIFLPRIIPAGLEGLHQHRKHCQGEECKDRCCQATCAETICESPYLFKRPFPPKKCTFSTCQKQCCYDEAYCGNGLNAWSSACKAGKTKEMWCEEELGETRSEMTRDQWNHLVYEAVKDGTLPPGCEEDDAWSCRDNLHYGILNLFTLHKSDEGVSVNTVAVVPGATEALSGGDDQQVFKWRIVEGNLGLLRNYSSHTSPILQVAPFHDATFFCAATAKEAIVWLVQAGHDFTDSMEMEFTPEDPRKDAGPVSVTGCIGLNAYETTVVGLSNSYAALWEFKVSHFLSVPVDPKLEFRWEIEKDFGYYAKWPIWDTSNDIKNALLSWWEHRWNLFDGYTDTSRRLADDVDTETHYDVVGSLVSPDRELHGDSPWLKQVHTHVHLRKSEIWLLYNKLHRSSKAAPWDNTFTNLAWGDVPNFFYKPDGWGAVTSIVEIPSDTLFVLGYEDGSIRIWRTYNGFIVAVVPKAHAGCVTALLAAPAGNSFFSGGHDGFIRQWRATTGHPIGQIYAAFAGPVSSLAMIPGGNAIYSGHFSGHIYLWELAGKTALCHIDTEGGKVNSLAVNPGSIGQVLAAGEDGTVRVYAQR